MKTLNLKHLAVGAMALMALGLIPAQSAPLVTNGLKGYWSFDADSAADTSGHPAGPHNGTAVGTVAYSNDVPPGFPGKSADMRAGGTGIKVSTDGGLNTFFDMGSSMSLSYWRKGAFPGMWSGWITKDGEGSGGFRLISNGSPKMGLGCRGSAGDSPWGISVSAAADRWIHYAVTFGDGYGRFYENGVKVAEVGKSGSINVTKGALCFGCTSVEDGGAEGPPGNFANVWMDEVYVFDRALTADEVTKLYAGASGTIWDGGTGNWSNSNWSSGQPPAIGGSMVIDNTTNAPSSVTLTADFSANSLVLGASASSALTINSGQTLTLAGQASVGSSGTLQVNGTLTADKVVSGGTLGISNTGIVNANDFQITGGTTTTTGSGALNVPVTVTLSGGTLTYNNAATMTPQILRFDGGTLAGTGAVIPTVWFEVYKAMTIGSNMGGAAGLRGRNDWTSIGGDNRIILTGNNTYTGSTIPALAGGCIIRADDGVGLPAASFLDLSGYDIGFETGVNLIRPSGTSGPGKMRISDNNGVTLTAVGAVAGANPVIVCFGTLLAPESLTWGTAPFMPGANSTTSPLKLNTTAANNAIDFRNPINIGTSNPNMGSVRVDSGTYPATMSGVLSGVGGVTKSGAGELILSGTNTYTGNTTISDGTLTIGGAGCLGGGNYATNIILASGKTFKYNSSAAQTLSGTISGNGALIQAGSGTLNLSTNGSVGTASVTVSANTNQPVLKISGNYTIGTPTAGTLTVSGGAAGSQGILSLVDGTVNTLTLTNNSSGVAVFTIGGAGASESSILNMEVGATSDRIVVGNGLSKAKLLASGKKTVVNITGLGGLTGARQTLIEVLGGLDTGGVASFAEAFELGTVSGNMGGCTVTLGSDDWHLFLNVNSRSGTVLIVR